MEDANIIALFFERNEQAVQETDAAYGRNSMPSPTAFSIAGRTQKKA